MAAKEKATVSTIKPKKFAHPRIDHPLIVVLENVEDPRQPSLNFRYSLTTILFIVLITIICGAEDWAQITVMAEGMKEWIGHYVDMSSGIPCERTFKNVFNAIKPEEMERLLRQVASMIRSKVLGEVVNFDGQTERGTADKYAHLSGIHLLNAWSADNRLCLGQLKVDDKSNEITALPKLMEMLDLKGTIITADALNTQKTTAAKAIEVGADYVLPVKGNQPALLEEIKSAFDQLDKEQQRAREHHERALQKAQETRDKQRIEKLLKKGVNLCGATRYSTEEKGHGRIEQRSCTAIAAKDLPAKEEWERLNTIARVYRKREENGKVHEEEIYYISSLKPDAEQIANVVRQHWQVENSLHWRLDVIFRQDKSRYRNRVGARNLAAVRKTALNALIKETSLKKGVATKQRAAACNPAYRERVLKNLF